MAGPKQNQGGFPRRDPPAQATKGKQNRSLRPWYFLIFSNFEDRVDGARMLIVDGEALPQTCLPTSSSRLKGMWEFHGKEHTIWQELKAFPDT